MRIAGSLLPLLPSLTPASLPRALLESFVFYFQLLLWLGPLSTLGPAQGQLEGTPGDPNPTLGDISGFP